MRRSLILVAFVLVCTAGVSGQMAHRLKGSIRTTAGVPLVGATVRGDAITGFRGEQFAGAKEQVATSLATGEWNITGLEAGLWMFSTAAPDMLPAVIVIPVKFSQRQQVSAIGNALTWQLPRWAMPATQHPALARTLFDMVLQLQPAHPRAARAAAIDDLRGIARIQ